MRKRVACAMGGFAVLAGSTGARRYSTSGTFLNAVTRPGEAADDADLDIADVPLTLNSTPVPAGTLLFTNGETGSADVYAIDPGTGSVLATLMTSFGASHVVGGAYHPGRHTFFFVQDRVPSGTSVDNLIAEVNPATGVVINSFKVTAALSTFTVNYGDIEVSRSTGNLLVVSSDETTILELTPTGSLVQALTLPTGVSDLSGIAMIDATGGAWVTSSGGVVSHISGVAAPFVSLVGDTNDDGVVDLVDLNNVLNNFGANTPNNVGDDDGNGVVDLGDLNNVLNNFGAHAAAGALATVPEPAAASACGLAAAAVSVRRRRR